MKIILLSDVSSEHTEKWALGFASLGIKVYLFSLHQPFYNWYDGVENICYIGINKKINTGSNVFSKLTYLKVLPGLKRQIKKIKPDIVHAHYATSYGLLAYLSGFRPYIISAWGTDVMKFPQQNVMNLLLLRNNLKHAAVVCATSNTIKQFILQVVKREVEVVPFGVDTKVFKPGKKEQVKDKLIISCIKSLEKIYCLDILIDAFASLKNKYPEMPMKLVLLGHGKERINLEEQVKKWKLEEHVEFTGRIHFSKVPAYFQETDIFVNISEYESFGVSVVEAMSCEKPVIVTNVGGLKEIVEEGVEGLRIPVRDVAATTKALEKLILSFGLREKMGKAGRDKVLRLYKWDNNLLQMIKIYQKVRSGR